jgi:DNA repair protein RecN (Recombination protein N)
VDSYNSKENSQLKEKVALYYAKYTQTKIKLNSLVANYEENLRKRDFMRYELDEIRSANLRLNEDDELSDEVTLLQNSEKIYQNLLAAYAISYEDSPSALDELKKALNLLQDISEYSKEISGITEEFSDSYYKLEDLCREIRNVRDKTVFSQEELDNTMARLDLIEGLKRKYGGSIEKVLQCADNLEEQLSYIENIDEAKTTLSAELVEIEESLRNASEELSKLRKQSAKELEEKILNELKELNFKDSNLGIAFYEESGYTATGIDKVEFLISTNKGEPLKSLSKIASGGEMSRIMLAFKKIIADYDEIATMIFDEIDNGISGLTASIVGKKLCQIAKKHQIVCITHLPQIASFGEHSYKIQKNSDANMTYTTVAKLNENEQITEIARLLGGMNITEKNLENARELVNLSRGENKNI